VIAGDTRWLEPSGHWPSSLMGDSSAPLRYLRLMAQGKPHLLTSSESNLGRQTRLSYTSSTRFYPEDRASGRPWATRLPFPVQVLESVEVLDQGTGWRVANGYAYHHGSLHTVTASTYGVRRVQPVGGNRHAAFLVVDDQSLSWTFERDISDPRTSHLLALLVNEYGKVTRLAAVAYPRISATGAQAKTHIVVTETDLINADEPGGGPLQLGLPPETRVTPRARLPHEIDIEAVGGDVGRIRITRTTVDIP